MAEKLKNCPFCDGEARPVKQIEGRYAIARYSISCDGCGLVAFYEATEAEAIAAWNTRATQGTLTAEQVRECVQHVYYEGYNDGSVHRAHGIEETDWQAIADELNAEMGSGTCEIEHVKNGAMYDVWRYTCCGYEHAESVSEEAIPQNFCPKCGARVV